MRCIQRIGSHEVGSFNHRSCAPSQQFRPAGPFGVCDLRETFDEFVIELDKHFASSHVLTVRHTDRTLVAVRRMYHE